MHANQWIINNCIFFFENIVLELIIKLLLNFNLAHYAGILAKEGIHNPSFLVLHFSPPCILYQLLADAWDVITPPPPPTIIILSFNEILVYQKKKKKKL